jgi:pimeloyl-ACP methyl ester carboxylesterase
VPELERPDGAKIHYEVRGEEGPPAIFTPHWTWSPGVWAELLDDLARDHRLITYHLRGTGQSSRVGPYDMETDVGDLEAVVEQIGGPALVFGTADSSNRAVRVGAGRPDLVSAVVCFGAGPISRAELGEREAMLSSDSVVSAFIDTFERSYRAGLRTLVEATNPQMSEEQLRERVDAQAEFSPQDATVARLRVWVADDPVEAARSLGDRLWIFSAGSVAGPWLPDRDELERMTAKSLPDAHLKPAVEPGPVSAPGPTADAMREVSAPLRAGQTSDH